jgi:hypothetical protein
MMSFAKVVFVLNLHERGMTFIFDVCFTFRVKLIIFKVYLNIHPYIEKYQIFSVAIETNLFAIL